MSHDPAKLPDPDARLRAHGLRATRARRLILELLAGRHDHPTTEQLHDALKARGEQVGTATLYQNLHRLVEAGIIGRLMDPRGLLRYEGNTAPHHHLVCVHCGRIVDAEIERLLPALGLPRDAHTGAPLHEWSLKGVRLELKGLCPDCR